MINDLFRTQSGQKVKYREPVLTFLDEKVSKGLQQFDELTPSDQQKSVALLLKSLDRYCLSEWLMNHGIALIINDAVASVLKGNKVTLLDDQMLLQILSVHAVVYYRPYLDSYIMSAAERLKENNQSKRYELERRQNMSW